MRKIRAAATATVAAVVALSIAGPASAYTTGDTEGCTPGYWKNHTSSWLEDPDSRPFAPSTPLGTWFPATHQTGYFATTALEALQGGGGKGVDGAERVLLRAATASYLNSAHESIAYPLHRFTRTDGTVARVNTALRSQDRAQMLTLADELDRHNDLGCPLS